MEYYDVWFCERGCVLESVIEVVAVSVADAKRHVRGAESSGLYGHRGVFSRGIVASSPFVRAGGSDSASSQEEARVREILIHLNVSLEDDDPRTVEAVEAAVAGALEVGSAEGSPAERLEYVIALAEEISAETPV